ncbi:MAG TPA: magnesium/cobalt transporter CorA [Myxococcota bacterium]|nr:magnesium/cobalt transporter CorA [Myxococcota bacterium]
MSARRAFRKRQPPAGSRPGTLALPPDPPPRHICAIAWTADEYEEREITDLTELARDTRTDRVSWIAIRGLGDEAGLRRIAETFEIHPLALADVVNVPQRPKFDAFETHDLVICRVATIDPQGECQFEQVSLVIGLHWVLSFQEAGEDLFGPVRTRIRSGAPIRTKGADYLAYALIDTLIDGYYPVVEQLGDALEDLESEAVSQPTKRTLQRIHDRRRLILTLIRIMRQQRDAVQSLMRAEGSRRSADVGVYYRDAYDHAAQISELLETYRELALSLMEVYLSSVSNRLNEVMKVLTVIGSIFLPLSFLAGVYGMNFHNMPELGWPWAYPALWIVMLGIATGMFVYFRRRGWIGGFTGSGDDAEDE